MSIEVNAEFEQFGNWDIFTFIIPDGFDKSLHTKDNCGDFYVSDFKKDEKTISFLKHYTNGTVMFGDSDEVIHDSYVIEYQGIKKESDKIYCGIWKNKTMFEMGEDTPDNYGKSRITITNKKD